MEWETVIGLEVHAQLKTKSKLFSTAASAYGAEPNTQACTIDMGLPGVLPVLNEAAVHMALKFGLAVGATIPETSYFSRKNYFYPDLPKGYQITQHAHPIITSGGCLHITLDDGSTKRIDISSAHLEEDSGKSLHEDFHGMTGLDFNRAGMTLLEIISEPDMRSAKEAVAYLKTLHTLLRYLDICDGNMQEGSFRCDANVSVRPMGEGDLGTRTEMKNINSFRFVERAIEYEAQRQIELITNGGVVTQETRLFDPAKNETRSLRSKEDAKDYRYFPEPDLLPLTITEAQLAAAKRQMPELPQAKHDRFVTDYGLNDYDAHILVTHPDTAHYFESTIQHTEADPKLIANWIIVELAGALNKSGKNIADSPINPEQLAALLQRIHDQTISGKIAKAIFESMWQEEGDVDSIIEKQGLKQVTDTQAINDLIDQVIADNPDELAAYRSGKTKLFGYFVGQAMKLSKGKANPQQVNTLLKEKL